MAIEINHKRIEVLGALFRDFGIKNILIIEESDPQYEALRHLYNKVGDCGILALISIANALVSYQLTSKGEEYWWELAKWPRLSRRYINDPLEAIKEFKNFLENSTGNRFALKNKISRIDRLVRSEFHIEIYVKYLEYSKNIIDLVYRLAKIMRQDTSSKTIVFAAKMFYYSMRICNSPVYGISKIEMPIDRRVSLISYTSGLIDVMFGVHRVSDLLDKIMRQSKKVQGAWRRVSDISGIPPLNIDSVIWIIGRYIDKYNDPVNEAVDYIEKSTNNRISRKTIYPLVRELLLRKIRSL